MRALANRLSAILVLIEARNEPWLSLWRSGRMALALAPAVDSHSLPAGPQPDSGEAPKGPADTVARQRASLRLFAASPLILKRWLEVARVAL
jgi:hypothetical protein